MAIEIKAPIFPEAVERGVISQIYAEPGLGIKKDEVLFDIETDKVILEVVAPEDGRVKEYIVGLDEKLESGQVVGVFEPGEVIDSEVSSPSDFGHSPPINMAQTTANKTMQAIAILTIFVLGALFGAAVLWAFGEGYNKAIM